MSDFQHAQLDWDENGQPLSRAFGDVYFSRHSGLNETRHVFLATNRLAERFAGSHGLQLADVPFEMAPVQVNLIWHRQQEATPGLQWLREQIVQIEQG
ncbi:hypothetical protein HKW74_19380 [Pseudomonas aeruginosa]|nr:hypothetical protein [Pseudomonas aeruginosa]MBF3221611.1 hypothetical protein [Pseudomonas aeruginosa]MBF3229710.1 hypothetical protein [Pseudomonas aeruginosa]MBF3242916.1 hypothetical protein [Pseudomonas aeruginosa]MBF3270987.1 hypothetical protein [Pseudomonas aeruginosa]